MYEFGMLTLSPLSRIANSETILVRKIELLEIATVENVEKIGGDIGWGVAQATTLGSEGLLANMLVGERKE